MAYIGKEPADSFISFAKQDFSTSATTSYTLDNAVANENELALFINFVRQEPTTAYTASGTTLTLTSATASTDDMYCVYLGQAKQTVNAPDGSVGSSQVSSTIITGQTAETSIATDDTVLIHDTSAGALRKMTRANFVSGVGGDLTPAFSAYLSANQVASDASWTKVQCNTEVLDTDGTYDNSSNYRFTPASTGYYLINAGITLKFTENTIVDSYLSIYKNGSQTALSEGYGNSSSKETWRNHNLNIIVNCTSTSDYYELYSYGDPTSGDVTFAGNSTVQKTFFNAFKLIT
jgi:hypothetical protein